MGWLIWIDGMQWMTKRGGINGMAGMNVMAHINGQDTWH